MTKLARSSPKPVEVMGMCEPHRLPPDLLHAASALLVPLPSRRTESGQAPAVPTHVQPHKDTARRVS
jgi:hypothetical protein